MAKLDIGATELNMCVALLEIGVAMLMLFILS